MVGHRICTAQIAWLRYCTAETITSVEWKGWRRVYVRFAWDVGTWGSISFCRRGQELKIRVGFKAVLHTAGIYLISKIKVSNALKIHKHYFFWTFKIYHASSLLELFCVANPKLYGRNNYEVGIAGTTLADYRIAISSTPLCHIHDDRLTLTYHSIQTFCKISIEVDALKSLGTAHLKHSKMDRHVQSSRQAISIDQFEQVSR